ncbi:hypothetical protein [Poseidonibacter ostreae]|uniref:Uncharacterized protein n=1 Tax=Poseidonibacter ostreae TaxID=2654171 RepID=A0A6L4WWZ4_9BACT|nr:hypothetical protein [Poseidonibacter ostreae]KAB7891379.1 hypothetical protein GBG19_00655 [Poseidonibacter ostreae]
MKNNNQIYNMTEYEEGIHLLRLTIESGIDEIAKGMTSTDYFKYATKANEELLKLDGIVKEKTLREILINIAIKENGFVFADLGIEKKDFLTISGENVGTIIHSRLAKFIGTAEGTTRALSKTNPKRYDCLYLGAFCMINDITKEDLLKINK